MYKRLTALERTHVDTLLDGLSLQQRIAQTFVVHAKKLPPDKIVDLYRRCPFGGIFYAYRTATETAAIGKALQTEAQVPVIGTADLVNGAGSRIENCTLFPWQMAVGATDSEECANKMGRATAIEGRAAGIHWTFGPIVDLSLNINNSMMHTRAFGDDRDHVTRMARAFIRGVQSQNMVATAKHFPGDGIDDRDSHICTSINSLGEDEWMELFEPIWRGSFEEGVGCVMSGHIALPWIDPSESYLGPAPATLSAKIQIELLRERLGFDGVVISDAIPMIGFSAFAPYEVRVPLNIQSGSDMILWPDPENDIPIMERALDAGLLTEERLNTAVRNILALKLRLGLFADDGVYTGPPLWFRDDARSEAAAVAGAASGETGPSGEAAVDTATIHAWADEIGEKSICIVRNENDLLPLSLPKSAKVLTVSCAFDEDTRGFVQELTTVDQELRSRGYVVEHLLNPSNDTLNARCTEFDAIFMNIHVMPRYGTTRMFGQIASIFWNSFWHKHDTVVFTSFGDPYKLYEMPYVPNFVMTFSNTPSSQRAAVRTWLGEIPAAGKLPVSLEGYYQRQV